MDEYDQMFCWNYSVDFIELYSASLCAKCIEIDGISEFTLPTRNQIRGDKWHHAARMLFSPLKSRRFRQLKLRHEHEDRSVIEQFNKQSHSPLFE